MPAKMVVLIAQSANSCTSVQISCSSAGVRTMTTVTILPTPSRSATGSVALSGCTLNYFSRCVGGWQIIIDRSRQGANLSRIADVSQFAPSTLPQHYLPSATIAAQTATIPPETDCFLGIPKEMRQEDGVRVCGVCYEYPADK